MCMLSPFRQHTKYLECPPQVRRESSVFWTDSNHRARHKLVPFLKKHRRRVDARKTVHWHNTRYVLVHHASRREFQSILDLEFCSAFHSQGSESDAYGQLHQQRQFRDNVRFPAPIAAFGDPPFQVVLVDSLHLQPL